MNFLFYNVIPQNSCSFFRFFLSENLSHELLVLQYDKSKFMVTCPNFSPMMLKFIGTLLQLNGMVRFNSSYCLLSIGLNCLIKVFSWAKVRIRKCRRNQSRIEEWCKIYVLIIEINKDLKTLPYIWHYKTLLPQI